MPGAGGHSGAGSRGGVMLRDPSIPRAQSQQGAVNGAQTPLRLHTLCF